MSGGKQRAQHLMMARIDGELTGDERAELDALLAGDEQLRAEWERLGALKEVTDTMGYSEPAAETWDTYWVSIYNRLERGVGWVLVSLGATVLLGYLSWELMSALFADSSIPLFVSLAILAMVLGSALLLVSVIRERLFTRKSERYKGIQR